MVFGLPTETVYGLAAPIDRPDLIEKIFKIKNRPRTNPLIVHVSSIEMARGLSSDFSSVAQHLSELFWPGPLTLVVPKNPERISDTVSAGQKTVALRCPAHPLALKIINSIGPLVAPSANPSGKLSPVEIAMLKNFYPDNKEIFWIDGGPSERGIESTIIELKKDTAKILRPGPIKFLELSEILKKAKVKLERNTVNSSSRVPGQDLRHYQPELPLYIFASHYEEREMVQAISEFTGRPIALEHIHFIELSEKVGVCEAELYRLLFRVEADKKVIALKCPLNRGGVWEAIENRLHKAKTASFP